MRIRGYLLAVLVTALAVPAVAGADTTLGITTAPAGSTANTCPSGPSPPANELFLEFGSGSPFGGPLSVPSGSGSLAVTHWAVNASGVLANTQLTLAVMTLVLSPSPSITIVGTDTETLKPPASPAADVESFTLAQPIPVQSGDFIGQYAPGATGGFTCYWSMGPGQSNTVEGFAQSGPPTVGEQIVPGGGGDIASDSDLNLAATLSPLTYDAALSLTAGPSNAVAGQPAVLTATVTNNGPLGGPITFTDPVPAGLAVDYAAGSGGTCSTSTVNIVTCSITSLAAGHSTKVAIVVTPKSAQRYSDAATVSLPGGAIDPNSANNNAATTLSVAAPGAPTRCVVPKLGGVPLAPSKKVLTLLGCKLAKVKTTPSKNVPKGDVISTNPRAGTYAVDRKIAITVSSGKPKKRHRT